MSAACTICRLDLPDIKAVNGTEKGNCQKRSSSSTTVRLLAVQESAKTYEDVADVPQTDEDAEVPAAPALGTMQLSGFATEKHQTTVSNVALETVYVAQIASPVSVTGSFIVYRTVSSSLKGQKLTSIVERGKIAAPRDEDRALFDIPSDFVKKTA